MKVYPQFNNRLAVQIFEPSKFGCSSEKAEFVKTFFNNDFTIHTSFKLDEKCKFDNGQYYGVFAKPGLHSGAYFNNGKFYCSMYYATPEGELPICHHEYEVDDPYKKYDLIYSYNSKELKFKTYFNGEWKETQFPYANLDYSMSPLWVGAAGPYYDDEQNRWLFYGEIYGITICLKCFSNEEALELLKGPENIVNSNIVESYMCWFDFDLYNWSRFKIFDKSGNGIHAVIPEHGFPNLIKKLRSYATLREEIFYEPDFTKQELI